MTAIAARMAHLSGARKPCTKALAMLPLVTEMQIVRPGLITIIGVMSFLNATPAESNVVVEVV
jgi:hypothetical protein